MFRKTILAGALAVALGIAMGQTARAQIVQVGYADNIRPSPFFPVPWDGDAGVQYFLGGGPSYDAGAVRVINNTASAMVLTSAHIDGFGDGTNYNIWGGLIGGGLSISPGMSLILTQTTPYNFDSSDN